MNFCLSFLDLGKFLDISMEACPKTDFGTLNKKPFAAGFSKSEPKGNTSKHSLKAFVRIKITFALFHIMVLTSFFAKLTSFFSKLTSFFSK